MGLEGALCTEDVPMGESRAQGADWFHRCDHPNIPR